MLLFDSGVVRRNVGIYSSLDSNETQYEGSQYPLPRCWCGAIFCEAYCVCLTNIQSLQSTVEQQEVKGQSDSFVLLKREPLIIKSKLGCAKSKKFAKISKVG